MPDEQQNIFIPAATMSAVFKGILAGNGMQEEKAIQCADIFTANSLDAVYSHGVNRFARFIRDIQKGQVQVNATASLQQQTGNFEQWNGHLGPGILNATAATDAAMKIAGEKGIGCIALSNTNHWMRGGAYGWQAARAGYVFIGWTNTIANMPAWGAVDARLGNNPFVIAIPFNHEAIVLDMAMSQYSFGAMEKAILYRKALSQPGGYDEQGQLTTDPAAIIHTRRTLPIGYWKGAGLSLLLDILAAILSGGDATHTITKRKEEKGLSQVFIAISLAKLSHAQSINQIVSDIIDDYKLSVQINKDNPVLYPGERVIRDRERNQVHGIPVHQQIWNEILSLK